MNGASGIAVGMATNMAPHNLTEVIDGIVAYIDNKEIDVDGLMQYVKAPDFPTGGIIYGYEGVKEAFTLVEVELLCVQKQVLNPYKVENALLLLKFHIKLNKAEMIKKTADLMQR
jgi:DNA gyrase subunit A